MRRDADSSVRAWAEPVVIPTYRVVAADRNPMFLERRVYQGSSGRVYPNAFTDRISDEKVEHAWQGLHLENEYLRLLILPEIGGRIHIARDRTNEYDFIYRQRVIKPALVGLLGPWISGGVEFNWPQHHRPSTFMPVDWAITADGDGGRTIWTGEHEPMNRMKGMVGIHLRPASSVVEIRVRLANRTPYVQTFLWWANIAVRVHDAYQSFFPEDVTYVADHARRAVSTFPIARGTYYGVDYGSRPASEADLSWYRNIPVPTSYMAIGTRQDFFGGYDHAAEAGVVHVADHRISPGKKQWTWGNHAFGRAWDRELTDDDGPYIELMAGVYTDNQPDFSFLAPYETRTFSQFLYPIRQIGPPHQANVEAAVSLTVRGQQAHIGVAVTGRRPNSAVVLDAAAGALFETSANLAPDTPYVGRVELPDGVERTDLRLTVHAADGCVLLSYRPTPTTASLVPRPAEEPRLPESMASVEELYLTGLHLEQYRHATRSPEPYWREGLRRDAGDARCNTALAAWHLRRGELDKAEAHLRRALDRQTRRNPNPYDGEASYLLGLVLLHAGRLDEAEDALVKATWNAAWQGPAEYALARLAGLRGDWSSALNRLDRALAANPRHASGVDLRAAVLRRLGRAQEARDLAAAQLASDPLDAWAREELRLAGGAGSGADAKLAESTVAFRGDAQTALDLALDYAGAGMDEEAIGILTRLLDAADDAPVVSPMVHYTLAWLLSRQGDGAAADHRALASRMPPDYCFPARLEEIAILEAAEAANPGDARAPYYLGNLLYDRRRYQEAIAAWRRARHRDASFPTVHRNLGLAAFNVLHRPLQARSAYLRAFRLDPTDGRVLYELDQLRKRLNEDPAGRLRRLDAHRHLVDSRDDLAVEYATLLNQRGRAGDALGYLLGRRFHPWEGGEGLVSEQYVRAQLALGRAALSDGRAADAVEHFEGARHYPQNLGEGKHLLTPEHETLYELGLAHAANGDDRRAREAWDEASAAPAGGPLGAATYFQALALRALGREAAATRLLEALLRHARRQARQTVRIDYFATSLPALLLFDEDLQQRNTVAAGYLEGLAQLGLGRLPQARAALQEVLSQDVNHAGAREVLERQQH